MYVIAEVAQAHDGSLGNALSFIKAISKTGCDAIKFQMHYASEESTNEDKFRVNTFPQDVNRYEYWKRMEFTIEQWKMISDACSSDDIDLIISPFSNKAIDICKTLKLSALKIGSGEYQNTELLDKAFSTHRRVIVSTGMCTDEEVLSYGKYCKQRCENLSLLQCTSKYPCNIDEIGLKRYPRISKS